MEALGGQRRSRRGRWWIISVGGLVLFLTAMVLVPDVLAPRGAFASEGDAVRAQNDVRSLVLQAVGGLVVVVGAYATWRQMQINREELNRNLQATAHQLRATQDQLRLAEQAQITERWTRAVGQLASDQPVVRMGGVFAMELIATDWPPSADAIAETLSAFVRQQAARLPSQGSAGAGLPGQGDVPHLICRASDIQAALTVFGRGTLRPQRDRLRLLETDLRRANLYRADLSGADLEGARLSHAWLREARLDDCDLANADLSQVDLQGASLERTDLTNAILCHARLDGANLAHAVISGTDFRGASADPTTIWPKGFVPIDAGIVLA